MKQGSITSRIITVVLALFLSAYIGYQAWRSLYNPVRTVSAVYTQSDDAIALDGQIVRSESPLSASFGTGVLEMEMYEGERAAKGSAVAVIYENEESVEKSRKAAELEAQLARLNTLYSQSGEAYDLGAANDRIAECSGSLVGMIQNGMLSDMGDAVEDLKLQTMLRAYIYRDKSELLSVIDELKAERKTLGSGASAIKKRIYAPQAGYFSQNVDGYESAFDLDKLESMTPTEFSKLSQGFGVSDDAVGKIITSNTWFFAAVTDEQTASRFKLGGDVTLKFPGKVQPDVQAVTYRISEPENGSVLVVFRCSTHISDFTKLRAVTAQVVLNTFSGLKVPREALRVDDSGQNGVYCLIESQVKFKPVDIIFEKDSYYISRYDSSDTKSLLLYDEIIVSAKNLEHKKVIK